MIEPVQSTEVIAFKNTFYDVGTLYESYYGGRFDIRTSNIRPIVEVGLGKTYAEADSLIAQDKTFSDSIENIAKSRSPEEAAAALFRGILKRNVDETGKGIYVNQIKRGVPISDIIRDIYQSYENRTRLVTQLYRELLERDPDPDGLKIYTDHLTQKGLDKVAEDLRKSSEYLSLSSRNNNKIVVNGEPLNIILAKLYQAQENKQREATENIHRLEAFEVKSDFDLGELYERFYGRKYDLSREDIPEDQSLIRAATRGLSFTEIEVLAAMQPAFHQRLEEITLKSPEEAVDLLYTSILKRPVDAAGKSIYVDKLKRGVHTYEIIFELMQSEENRNRMIGQLYRELLGRDPDIEGLKIYSDQLQRKSVSDVAKEIKESGEYREINPQDRARISFNGKRTEYVAALCFRRLEQNKAVGNHTDEEYKRVSEERDTLARQLEELRRAQNSNNSNADKSLRSMQMQIEGLQRRNEALEQAEKSFDQKIRIKDQEKMRIEDQLVRAQAELRRKESDDRDIFDTMKLLQQEIDRLRQGRPLIPDQSPEGVWLLVFGHSPITFSRLSREGKKDLADKILRLAARAWHPEAAKSRKYEDDLKELTAWCQRYTG